MIKHLITGGCSFSTLRESALGWITQLENKLKELNPMVTVEHTGYSSQGQELIQKKVQLAITDALDSNMLPDEILAVVMWSGTYRKAWYIDNPGIVDDIAQGMKHFQGGMSALFLDLKNNNKNTAYFQTASGDSFAYDPMGGWFFTVNGSECQQPFVQQHYMLDGSLGGIGKVHTSLENIIMLQNFCKLTGIKLINQFYMDHVMQDVENKKDHQAINYLYKQLDWPNMIVEGMFETVHELLNVERLSAVSLTHEERKALNSNTNYFSNDGFHPGVEGHRYWCNKVLFPFLKNKNILC